MLRGGLLGGGRGWGRGMRVRFDIDRGEDLKMDDGIVATIYMVIYNDT